MLATLGFIVVLLMIYLIENMNIKTHVDILTIMANCIIVTMDILVKLEILLLMRLLYVGNERRIVTLIGYKAHSSLLSSRLKSKLK